MGKSPADSQTLNTLSPLPADLRRKPGHYRFIALDEQYFLMTLPSTSITPKAIQDLLDELEASKQSRLRAWNVLQRLRLVLSELGNIAIPPSAQKTFDAEGEILGTCFDKILPDSERGDQKSVFLGSPLSGCDHQGRMQKRLSARSSGVVESVGSGGRSDSELTMCGRYRRTTSEEELARRYHIAITPILIAFP